jgi:endonuclease/exonuclease/phosphatase (EEP) superfamily protein YafD
MTTPQTLPPPALDTLQKQYAYFIYRSLDCFSHAVTGTSRDRLHFDRSARLYARIINLLLRNGDALPAFTDVLPACEALNALLFHCCMCHREAFWPSFVLARRLCFAELLPAARQADDAEGGHGALAQLFERAVEEFGRAQPADAPADDARREQLAIQITELAALLRGEVAAAAAAVPEAA